MAMSNMFPCVQTKQFDEKDRAKSLVTLLEAADSAANRSYLVSCANRDVVPFYNQLLESGETKSLQQMSMFKIEKLMFDADEKPSDKLKSFFLAFSGLMHDPSVFFLLQNKNVKKYNEFGDLISDGNQFEFSLYLGVKPQGMGHDNVAAVGIREMFKRSFESVFLGSKMSPALSSDEMRAIQEDALYSKKYRASNVVCVTARPSEKKDSDDKTIQVGLEQFIDVMRGREYTAVLLASPVSKDVVEYRKRDIENLYSKLTLFQKVSMAFGENISESVGTSITESMSLGKSNGTSFTSTHSKSETFGEGGGESSSSSHEGYSSSSSSSWNRSQTIGFSTSEGTSTTVSSTETKGTGQTENKTTGSSITHTIEAQNKGVVDLLSKLDITLKSMNDAEAFGLWECAGYFMAPTIDDAAIAANTFKSLIVGEESSGEKSHVLNWPMSLANFKSQQMLCSYILNGEHPVLERKDSDVFRRVIPTNFVSGSDLPYFLRLPKKSVSGLPVDSMASFERSVVHVGASNPQPLPIPFGKVYHMGMEESPVSLDLADFTKHCFICGSTGSGKSKTTELLLKRCIENSSRRVHFLVVEPAKGEYKKTFKNVPGINIFTTHPLCETLLHINPFRFEKGVHVLEHIDRLLGIFSSCWELSAAMPALLKKGVERAYQQAGWDLVNSYYVGRGAEKYPTFANLTDALRLVIDSSGYSGEVKGNYIGSLVTRVESLAAGVLRQIFCNEYDIPSRQLFDEDTIVDLSRLGSSETKSLIMGVLIMLLSEHRQVKADKTDAKIRHITVIEEAHNLLRNSATGGSGGSDMVKKSVEMISDAIAEMRTYGEGFLIVDQSPTAVDISAIKNTNTKIIMRLPEQHDCEAVASAVSLNEVQTKEISKLTPGVAVVMQNGWASAVLVHVDDERKLPEKERYKYVGTEEWTDVEFNRKLRAKLALEAIRIARKKIDDINENGGTARHVKEATTVESQLGGVLDAFVASSYRDFVGEKRYAELQVKQIDFPEPARSRELREMIKYYATEWSLNSSSHVIDIRDIACGFGALATAILGCRDCWRTFLDLPMQKRCEGAFCDIVRRYVPEEMIGGVGDAIRSFMGLVTWIRLYMTFGRGAIESGATVEEATKFRDAARLKDGEKTK